MIAITVNINSYLHNTMPAQRRRWGWRRGVAVSGVCRMNEVNPRWARLVLGWVAVFGPVYYRSYVTSQLGQLSLASFWGH